MTSSALQRFLAADHRRVFAIALPMIISNIAAPMLGLVDTAIIGHLPQAIYLSSVALGAMAVNFIYLLAIFLRMSTTGVVAQAYGAEDIKAQQRHFAHGVLFAVVLGTVMLLATPLILAALWGITETTEELRELTATYVSIRLWGAPAALLNLVILGVLLGRQKARAAMFLVIFTNAVNVIGDVILIIGLGMHVQGAALATITAEWSTAIVGLWILMRQLKLSVRNWPRPHWLESKMLLSLNRDILIRSLLLQLCIAMMTAYASYFGATTVAANAVLMQFLMLISLGLDGIAYSVEALLGQAKGQKRTDKMHYWFKLTLLWSALFAAAYSVIFWLAGGYIIRLITNIPEVIQAAETYLPWLIVMPLLAHWSYFFDGVYIGLSKSKAMRDTMFIATVFGFFPIWWFTRELENHGLWLALSTFMVLRGAAQYIYLKRTRMLKETGTEVPVN